MFIFLKHWHFIPARILNDFGVDYIVSFSHGLALDQADDNIAMLKI